MLNIQHTGVLIIKTLIPGLIVLVLMSGLALADTGVPQVAETQGFSTATAISTIGTVTETDTIITQNINCGWCGLPVPLPLNPWDHIVYTSSYVENTIADQGLVSYSKNIRADTAGMAAENQFNVVTDRIVEFVGSDTGRMVSDESSLIDGVGTVIPTSEVLLCPFTGDLTYYNPPFCNIVQEGSSVDLTLGSLATSTEERHIMLVAGSAVPDSPDPQGRVYPASGPGVESNYNIRLTGFGDIPAIGSAEAFMNVHVQEGATIDIRGTPKSEDLVYSEMTTAGGELTLFQKAMNYQSKITGHAVWIEHL
jgi:hypothetical protein